MNATNASPALTEIKNSIKEIKNWTLEKKFALNDIKMEALLSPRFSETIYILPSMLVTRLGQTYRRLTPEESQHSHVTCGQQNGQKSFHNAAPELWNHVPIACEKCHITTRGVANGVGGGGGRGRLHPHPDTKNREGEKNQEEIEGGKEMEKREKRKKEGERRGNGRKREKEENESVTVL